MHQQILAALVSVMMLGCASEKQPSPARTDSTRQSSLPRMTPTIPTFDGKRAFGYLTQQTDFGPRNPNSVGHQKCLNFLVNELRGFADDVRLQEFAQQGYDNEVLRLTNIIAAYNTHATSRILLCAHWDTRPRAERDERKNRRNDPILGANDGASGVAVLLEIASLLKAQRPSIGVDIMLWDGEDYGREGDIQNYLLGSKYFARTKPADYSPRFGILLDMVGDKFLELPKEGYSMKYASDIVDLVWGKARELGYPQFVGEIGEEIMDDHLPLNEAGIKTIDIIDFNYPDQTHRYWHTHQDVPENCSPESLEAVGRVLTELVYTQKL